MELFQKAKAVRLRSHHEKYLLAEDDEESVHQDSDGASKSARWTVEFTGESHVVRLKSCYGKYLTASGVKFLTGLTGMKVLQTLPGELDPSIEWEPVRDGFHVKLRSCYGKFLRANGGLPPWKNTVTHDIPHRTATQDWVLWGIEVVEIRILSPAQEHHLLSSICSSPVTEKNGGSPRFSRLKVRCPACFVHDSLTVTSTSRHTVRGKGPDRNEGMTNFQENGWSVAGLKRLFPGLGPRKGEEVSSEGHLLSKL